MNSTDKKKELNFERGHHAERADRYLHGGICYLKCLNLGRVLSPQNPRPEEVPVDLFQRKAKRTHSP